MTVKCHRTKLKLFIMHGVCRTTELPDSLAVGLRLKHHHYLPRKMDLLSLLICTHYEQAHFWKYVNCLKTRCYIRCSKYFSFARNKIRRNVLEKNVLQ
jgi:hypothetical protein